MELPEGTMKATGLYAMCSKEHACTVRRVDPCAIKILTAKSLTDDQMKDLFMIAYGMMMTGGTLKDLIEVSAEAQPKDGEQYADPAD